MKLNPTMTATLRIAADVEAAKPGASLGRPQAGCWGSRAAGVVRQVKGLGPAVLRRLVGAGLLSVEYHPGSGNSSLMARYRITTEGLRCLGL